MERRIENDLYARQTNFYLSTNRNGIIVGAGGIGSWVAILAAMTGIPKLHIMDFDHLEVSNLNRLPFTLEDIGREKTKVVADFISNIRPDTEVETYGECSKLALGMAYNPDMYNTLFDCTDRISIQKFLSNWCDEMGVTYVRVGYDGLHITITNSIPDWSTDGDEDEGGYSITPSWVVPAIIAAAYGVAKATQFYDLEVSGNIDSLEFRKET
ncbi:MAG: ThiF family adenylyltransferase [Sphaerochaetaceae bacterium]|jgi:molybdopterin/thiamine biosynthesis adenylyltransferase|nr:ThiF family adenylyltransferase [Sphaerochaetaceae bacterium]